jgi:hypothetical protein
VFRLEIELPELGYQRTTLLDREALDELLAAATAAAALLDAAAAAAAALLLGLAVAAARAVEKRHRLEKEGEKGEAKEKNSTLDEAL